MKVKASEIYAEANKLYAYLDTDLKDKSYDEQCVIKSKQMLALLLITYTEMAEMGHELAVQYMEQAERLTECRLDPLQNLVDAILNDLAEARPYDPPSPAGTNPPDESTPVTTGTVVPPASGAV